MVVYTQPNKLLQRKGEHSEGFKKVNMGKRKEVQEIIKHDESPETVEEFSPSSHKKHKKHKKKHSHKKRLSLDHEGEEILPDSMEELASSPKGAIKLKFKFGQETLGTKNVVTMTPETTDSIINVTDDVWENEEKDPSLKTKKPGDETSDEEKEWLSALEKGELDDYGEISKGKKDPSLMTARQRALKHGNKDQELLQLPTGYRQVELTEEQLKRREQRAHKRKQMAVEKREKDKKQTLDRLLKKQDSKIRGGHRRFKGKSDAPKVTYLNNATGITISVPNGIPFPLEAEEIVKPIVQKCGLKGCANTKKYACSKTGTPLCSLECYKKNLSIHKLSPPIAVTT